MGLLGGSKTSSSTDTKIDVREVSQADGDSRAIRGDGNIEGNKSIKVTEGDVVGNTIVDIRQQTDFGAIAGALDLAGDQGDNLLKGFTSFGDDLGDITGIAIRENTGLATDVVQSATRTSQDVLDFSEGIIDRFADSQSESDDRLSQTLGSFSDSLTAASTQGATKTAERITYVVAGMVALAFIFKR